MPQIFTIEKDYHNSRFDRWFKAKIISLPQSLIEKIIRQNKVKINKKKPKSSYRVQTGDLIEIYNIDRFKKNEKPKTLKYTPSKKEVNYYDDYIIENNDNFIVINKPIGISVQSGTKSFKNIIDILKQTKYFLNTKPYIVHRLDKETSGILIIAKSREFAQLFTSLFRIRKIHKTYLAVTHGRIKKKKTTLTDNLTTYEKGRKILQKAITHLKVIKSTDLYTLVELKPITGRKHQLRKQLLNINHPIVGDDKYFISHQKKNYYKELLLHAYKIKFMIKNMKYNFTAKYSNKFENFINKNL